MRLDIQPNLNADCIAMIERLEMYKKLLQHEINKIEEQQNVLKMFSAAGIQANDKITPLDEEPLPDFMARWKKEAGQRPQIVTEEELVKKVEEQMKADAA